MEWIVKDAERGSVTIRLEVVPLEDGAEMGARGKN